MDLATAVKLAKGAAKVAQKIQKYIEVDQKRRVRVKKDFIAGRFKSRLAGFPSGAVRMGVPDFSCPDFEIADGVMTIFATGDRTPFCDGASLCPDKIGSFDLMAAALAHDAIYAYMEEVAKAWGWSEADVRWLADGVFGKRLDEEAKRQKTATMRLAGGVISRVAYTAVRLFGGIYHRHKSKLLALLFCLCLGGGCAIPDIFEPSDEEPEYEVYSISTTPAAATVADGGSGSTSETPAGVVETSTANGQQMAQSADAVDFASLDWCWGGFNGKKAEAVGGCEINDLRVSSSGLSYKWASGGCEALGATGKGDYSQTLACLFVKIDGKWKGGKFDYLSTSRTTRDFANIREGYHGWDRTAIDRADAYAFVIVSANGRRRSNVIVANK